MPDSLSDPRSVEPGVRVKALIAEGSTVTIPVSKLPFTRVLRSVDEVYRMANVYHHEKTYDKALTLYTRFLTMHVEHLPKHPNYKEDYAREDAIKCKKKMHTAMDRCEQLKSLLKTQYAAEAEAYEKERAATLEKERQEHEAREAQRQSDAHLAAELAVVRPSAPPTVPSHETSGSYDPARFDAIAAAAIPAAPVVYNGLLDDHLPPTEYQSDGGVVPAAAAAPVIDRSSKPTASSGDVSPIGGLRRVDVPNELVQSFMRHANENTLKNVETCGILCATLRNNKFVISHCVIPKQTGTPDSCTTQDEHEVFMFQDAHDLITVGWIHTHPSQTAFLSSVDMHTHFAYQVMLSESVAVVCSPNYNEVGIFNLTDPGMRQIGSCNESGFHPHNKDPPLFQSCAHSTIGHGAPAEVVDLR